MLDQLLEDAGYSQHRASFNSLDVIFSQGDPSENLYILVSGKVVLSRGSQAVQEIDQPGSLFGELAMLEHSHQTFTAQAVEPLQLFRIPKEHLNNFLIDYPFFSEKLNQALAQRLEETTNEFFGCRELGNQIPDAVIFTDNQGQILSMNRAAEELYGRTMDEMVRKHFATLLVHSDQWDVLVRDIQDKGSVQERHLQIQRSPREKVMLSLSMNALRDQDGAVTGHLLIGRDVTSQRSVETRFARLRKFVVPVGLILVTALAGIAYGFFYYSKGHQILDERKKVFREHFLHDFHSLDTVVSRPFSHRNREMINQLIQDYIAQEMMTKPPYKGIVLLDTNLKVFTAYSIDSGAIRTDLIGTSYADLDFKDHDIHPYQVQTLYRVDKHHPSGKKGVECAFALDVPGQFLGWLIFQMDMDMLQDQFAVDVKDLRNFEINSFLKSERNQ